MRKHTEIVHFTPRRMRLKVSDKRRNPQEMRRIAEFLNDHPKIQGVEANPVTGSILVHHGHGTLSEFRAIMEDLGVLLLSSTTLDLPAGSHEAAGAKLANAVDDLNRRLSLSSRGLLDLKLLVPLGFAALSLRQLLRYGLQVEAAPWYVMAYLAFDSFLKLHGQTGDRDGSVANAST